MSRAFAIIPAAGHSVRMGGRPKLLMPLGGKPLITHVIGAWQRGGVDRIIVVVRADNDALEGAVRALAVPSLELVQPDVPPPDMKVSIQAALRQIERNDSPTAHDCFLVAPGDIPRLSPGIIRALVAQHIQGAGQIVVPTVAGRRGHPVLFPWSLAPEVHGLAASEGLNAIVDRREIFTLPCDDLVRDLREPFADIDTLEEYRRMGGE